jgi:hypothetical protein
MDGWRASHVNHRHGHEIIAGTAATLRAARIRSNPIHGILVACRFVAPARHAVCAPPPLFAQRYARYKNALPKAHRDVHGGADERSTEHQRRRVRRRVVEKSGGPIRR